MTYLIYQEPTGDSYRRLLDWCARTAQRSLLVRRRTIDLDGSAQSLLEQLQPFAAGHSSAAEWPGTRLLDDVAEVHHYLVSDEYMRVIARAADRLYAWMQPALPEDLCFLRSDGSPVLTAISHEREAYLELPDDAADALLSDLHGLRVRVA